MIRIVCLAAIIGAFISAGCGQQSPPHGTKVTRDVQPAPEAAGLVKEPREPEHSLQSEPPDSATGEDAPVAQTEADSPTEQQTQPAGESATEDEAEIQDLLATSPVDVDEEMVETAVWAPAHRLFLPTTAGPLLVDVEIRFGDELLADAFDRRIKEVIDEAKDDSGSELTWNQLFAHVSADPDQFGRQNASNRGQYRQMIQQFDRNRNQRPDHDEVARFLFRNSGPGVPFRLIGTDYHREINRSESALFEAIDTDGDKVIDEAELERAPAALIRFDPNADQRIDPGEWFVQQDNDPAWDRRRLSRRGEVAMDLDGYVDWTMVSYSIDSMRGRAPFMAAANPVDRIDQDKDQSISADEAKQLREGRPDLRLKVTFAADSSGGPTIEVVWLRPEWKALRVNDRSPSAISLTDGRFALLATVTDRQSNRNRIPREVFEMLDANNDGALEEDEIPDAVPEEYSFEDLDADDDGKLTYQEINSASPSAAKPIWTAQVRARGAEFADGVFAWLDVNGDRLLSTREILTADSRLRQCSRDGKVVNPTDIPDTFAIQFMHADPTQDQQNFAFVSTIELSNSDWPRWAEQMDVNRDGEISQVEFPGTVSQFQKLDANGDGFVDSAELDN